MMVEAVGNDCFRGLKPTHGGATGFRKAVVSEPTLGAVREKPRSLLASRWGVRGLSWRYDVHADTMHRVVVRVLMTRVRKVTLPVASPIIRIWPIPLSVLHRRALCTHFRHPNQLDEAQRPVIAWEQSSLRMRGNLSAYWRSDKDECNPNITTGDMILENNWPRHGNKMCKVHGYGVFHNPTVVIISSSRHDVVARLSLNIVLRINTVPGGDKLEHVGCIEDLLVLILIRTSV
ncbi:hypothetical protein WN48_09308 [Eufriesea mexicana]|uniref:Uncharacterized protein n=1 Tax=Eufriesea mexicana TaxID=516756 RepID=A0A310S7C2_9HYME|nr:hypothetical protein WN48_09308 [Eufriesea mexicana]